MKLNLSAVLSSTKFRYAMVGLVSIIVIAYLGISWYVAAQVVARNYRSLTIPATQISTDYRDITFSTSDNLSLKGWFFPGKSDSVVIMVAGYGNTRVNDDYSGAKLMQDLLSQGFNIIAYDARGVGSSEGKHITQADHEWLDVKAAITYAKQQGFASNQIAIIASSMGATTIADNLAQFKDVGAIILDTPAKRFTVPVSWALSNEEGVPGIVHPGIYLAAKVLYGIDIPSVKPIENISADPNRTLLFLHASGDPLIPVQHSRDLLAQVGPQSQLVEFDTDMHIKTYATFPDKYLQTVIPFIQQQLSVK